VSFLQLFNFGRRKSAPLLPKPRTEKCGLCGHDIPKGTAIDHWVAHALEPIRVLNEKDPRAMERSPLVFTIERPALYTEFESTLKGVTEFFTRAILEMKRSFPFLKFEYHVMAYHENSGIIRSMLVIAEHR